MNHGVQLVLRQEGVQIATVRIDIENRFPAFEYFKCCGIPHITHSHSPPHERDINGFPGAGSHCRGVVLCGHTVAA